MEKCRVCGGSECIINGLKGKEAICVDCAYEKSIENLIGGPGSYDDTEPVIDDLEYDTYMQTLSK